MGIQSEQAAAYIDEEDCLGFKIWVAELELIVGGSRGKKKADAAQVFLLLQKLVITLDRTDRTEVREYQRRCEDALIDILLKGAPPPVRRLVCEALGKLYARGDQLPLFSRVSSLQLFLGTKEAFGKETSEDVRLGALELMTSLYYSQGRSLSIGVLETAVMAVKYCAKGSSDRTRRAALRLLAAAVEGVGGTHRNAAAVQNEALKALERLTKEKDVGTQVKLGMADVFRAIAAAGGAQLWTHSMSSYEFSRNACLAGVEDPDAPVRAAYARGLGEIVTAAMSSEDAKHSVAAAGAKQKHQQAQEKALAGVIEQCLVIPFAEAAAQSNRPACTALAQAWVHHLTGARLACGTDEAAFVEPALKPIDSLRAACLAAGTNPEKSPFTSDFELGLGIGGGERPHAQACVLYIMRAGVIEQLGEGGQRLLLERVTSLLRVSEEAGNAPLSPTPVGIVALEVAALLTEALGEVGPEAAAALEAAIASKLIGPHASLRVQAASALAALAVAEPARAGRLMSLSLSNLRSAADQVVDASAAGPDKSRPMPGTPRGPGSGRLKPEMNTLHGWALGSAALVAATPRLPLGVPSHYIRVAVQLAAALIEAPRTQFAAATCLEREAGYILLGPLCHVALPEVLAAYKETSVLSLWAPALGPEAAALLDAMLQSKESYVEFALAAELWWRTAAVQSFTAFIQALPASELQKQGDGDLIQGISGLLRPMLSLLGLHPTLRHPAKAKGGASSPLAGAVGMMQLRLLQAFQSLPPSTSIAFGDALSSLCIDAIKAAATGPANTGVLDFLIPALQASLDPADNEVGPWEAGRDPLERNLLQFQGAVGGPPAPVWQVGLRTGVGYAVDSTTRTAGAQQAKQDMSPYPQSLALGPALLVAQTEVLGTLLRMAPPAIQVKILDELLSIARSFPVAKKDRDAPKRLLAVLAASVPVLFSLGSSVSGSSPVTTTSEATEKVRALAEAATAEAFAGIISQRVAAGLYAATARISDDVASVQLIKTLCREAAETSSLPQRAAQALAVGSTSRAIGGLGLAAALPLAAQTLAALADASDSSIAPTILHALMTCSQAAGLSFVPNKILLSEDIYTVPGLLPAVGRLANAMVASLGPDYVLGSASYDACRSVVAEVRAPDASGVRRPEDSLAASLQSVLYAQMLVLFAPRALPAAQHVAVLVGTLPSRQPQLRKAAADTLRHLAERDANAVLEERIEPALLAALDGETDPATAAQLQATLGTLLDAGAAAQPSRWIALCGEIITAAGPKELSMPMSPSTNTIASSNGRRDGDSDNEDDSSSVQQGTPRRRGASVSPAGTPPRPGTPTSLQQQQAALTPRLRTRVFAAKCLLQVPGMAAAADPTHTDLAKAQADPTCGDWLVLRLQSLVDLGFKMATGQLDALRALGVDLMLAVLTHLGNAADPYAEGIAGARLLEQYQAQYVSTLRVSLAPEASPEVGASGAALAAAFLEKGLASGDAVVMERLMGLLCAPLSAWASGGSDPAQVAYAEWVAARARVALLESHAHCAALVAGGGDEAAKSIVVRAQGPFLTLLVECWTGVLHDYAVLTALEGNEGVDRAATYKLTLYGKGGNAARAPTISVVASGVGAALRRAWAVVLDACTYTLMHDRTVSYGASGKERHGTLVDLAVVAAQWGFSSTNNNSSSTDSQQHSRSDPQASVLRAIQRLSGSRFAKEGWLSTGVVAELAVVVAQALEHKSTLSSAALEAAAAAVEQLSAIAAPAKESAGAEEPLLIAATECIAAALPAKSTPVLTAALAALTHRLEAASTGGDEEAYVVLLHRSLAEGLQVLNSKQCNEEAAVVAASHLVATAKTAALRGATALISAVSVDDVLNGAAATAAQQAQHAAAAAVAQNNNGTTEVGAYRAGANLSSAIALGAFAISSSPSRSHSLQENIPLEAPIESEYGEDEWSEATFTGGTAAVPAMLGAASPTQQVCLVALEELLSNENRAIRLHAARALGSYLQSHPPPHWAAQCAAVGLPPSLAALHAMLQRGTMLTDSTELQFAIETLKCGLLACNIGGDMGAAALSLVVPIMVESAAPPGQPTPALSEVAVKLLVGLAAGNSAVAFKGAVAALPEDTRQRLQRALASVASTGPAVGAPAPGQMKSGAAQKLPSIQLKKFGAA